MSGGARAAASALVAAGVLAVAGAVPTPAQTTPPTEPTTSTTAGVEPTSPPTSEPEPTATTAAPLPEPVPTEPAPVPSEPAPPPGQPQGDGGAAAGRVPPAARRVAGSVRRSAPNGSRKLLDALAPLQDLGLTEQQAVAAGFGAFPVGGYATFSHDWLFPRFTPAFHLHQGTDIFAAAGTPVRAPAAGTLKLAQGGAGGLAVYVYQGDGTYYYLAHLSAFVAGQASGLRVRQGQVVGFVGDSGNAKGGSPHLHFEIHPAPVRRVVSGTGSNRSVTYVARPVAVGTVLPAVDPKATLDQWLRDALAAAPQLVDRAESRPRSLVATALTRRLGAGRPGGFPAPVVPPRSQLLWASAASPAGGALQLAEAEAMIAASELNWSAAARQQQEHQAAVAEAERRTEAILAPLTPAPLRPRSTAD